MPPARRRNTETTDNSKDTVQGAPGTDTQAAPAVNPGEPDNQAAVVRSEVVADGEPVRDPDDVKADERDVDHVDPSVGVPPVLSPEERERVLDDVAARAAEDDHAPASPIQQGTHAVLDTTIVPDEPSEKEKERREQVAADQPDEPCEEHYPDGWATVGFEPGARMSCEHGSWAYGDTPGTRSAVDEEASNDERGQRRREKEKAVIEAARKACAAHLDDPDAALSEDFDLAKAFEELDGDDKDSE